jgi:DNA gyrase/topoisomerase IV subunit B
MPELITAGKVYVGMPPLYKVEKKGVVKYAFNDEELDLACAELKAGAGDVQRYKGLGEMSAEQLWETTLNPRTRMLTKVNIEDERETDDVIDTLLNDDTQKRKAYIFNHANFNKVDKFAAKYTS